MGGEIRISSFYSRVWLEKWWEKDDGMTRYGGIVTGDGHGVGIGGNLCPCPKDKSKLQLNNLPIIF